MIRSRIMAKLQRIIDRQVRQWEIEKKITEKTIDKTTHGAEDIRKITVKMHPPICISRLLGAGARKIAVTLSENLGYILYGRDIINEIAKDIKVQRHLIDSLDESSRSNLETMLETFIRGHEIEWGEYHNSLVKIINTLASQGGVIFLGRGANYILKEKSALNIFITAAVNDRVKNVMNYDGITEKEALDKIRSFDKHRSDFLKQNFRIEFGKPEDFDLCISTSRFDEDKALELIYSALKIRGYDIEKMKIKMPD